MTSEVAIVNDALSLIGEATITAFDEGSRNADAAQRIYEARRDELLRAHPWNFATKRAALALSVRTPSHEFEHQFPVPSDYMRLIKVSDNDSGDGRAVYKIGADAIDGTVIMADVEQLWLTYVYKVTDPNLMPPDFRAALACRLAADLALPLAQSNSLRQQMLDAHRELMITAKSVDGLEDYPDQRPAGSWVESRGGSTGNWFRDWG